MTMRYAISVDVASTEIKGLWRGDKPAVPTSTGDTLSVEVTEAQHADISNKGMQFDGGATRFKWDGAAIVEQTDTRPRLRFTPDVVDVDTGEPPVNVTAEILKPDGTVDTTFNGRRLLEIDDDRNLRFIFVNGVATIQVRTNRGYSLVLPPQVDFRLEGAGLSVTVADTDIR